MQARSVLDDEYFVRTIVMRRDVGDNPSAAFALAAVHRSFTKPNKIGLTRALIESMSETPIYTPAGLYLGQAETYHADFNRLCTVIKRVTEGLYYHEYGVRLPDSCKCAAYALEGFASADPDVKAKIRRVLNVALSGEMRSLGANVFSYWSGRLADSALTSVWAYLVYGRVEFMAYTFPGEANVEYTSEPKDN
jgi:hypothetical protein